jgi:hypothetical protein
MMNEPMEEGFEVFVSDVSKPFGAVREVPSGGKGRLVIYVENAGDFVIEPGAVKAVHAQKVILDAGKLDERLRRAIAHAHDAEDPNI